MQEQQQEIRLLVMLALMGQLYSFLRSMEECIVTMVPELNSRLTNPEFGMSKTYRMYFRIFLGYRILSKLSTFYIDSTTHHIPIYTMLPLRQYSRLLMTDIKTSIHGSFSDHAMVHYVLLQKYKKPMIVYPYLSLSDKGSSILDIS